MHLRRGLFRQFALNALHIIVLNCGVSQAASETGSGASQVLSASENLSRQSEAVRQAVDKFLNEVRAAS